MNSSCTDDGGVCTCNDNVTGIKCDTCETGWYGFPSCQGEIYNSYMLIFEHFIIFEKCLQNVNVMRMAQ